jgi:zinc finger protein
MADTPNNKEVAQPQILKGEICPTCGKKTLTLMEYEQEIPYFGFACMFSMDCESEGCGYHKSDLELDNNKGPVKVEFTVESEEDLRVRVVKSGDATLKIPRIMTIEPGAASNGYVTNIEGILNRVKYMLEKTRDASDDKSEAKKCKNMIKKVQSALWGQEPLKITLVDPSGNSAIISEKAIISKGK